MTGPNIHWEIRRPHTRWQASATGQHVPVHDAAGRVVGEVTGWHPNAAGDALVLEGTIDGSALPRETGSFSIGFPAPPEGRPR